MTTESLSTLRWAGQAFRDFYPRIRADRWRLALLCVFNLITAVANALLIWMLGRAVSQIAAGEYDALNHTLIAIGGVVLFIQAVRLAYSYVFQHVTLGFVDRVRGELFEHIMRVSYPILSKFHKGDLITRLSGDVDALLMLVVTMPLQIFSNSVVLLVYGAMLVWTDWRLTLVALSVAPILFLSQRFVAPRAGDALRNLSRERALLVSEEEQTLSNLRGISAFNGERQVRAQHQRQFDIARGWNLKLRRIHVAYNTFIVILIYFTGVIVVYSGISSIRSGAMSIGELVSFLMFIRFMTPPLRAIAHIPTQLQTTRVAAERVMEIMHAQPATTEPAQHVDLPVRAGRIVIDDVTFSYPNSPRPVFSHLTLNIEAGESIALVGPSGAGKSTLASLLLRFQDPQRGTISIDGVDIRTVSLAALRDSISIVWQSPYIFDGSIRANLLLARPDATEAQMVAACRSSHAGEFIEALPDRLDTRVGVDGTGLSVGQVQRIAVAQAFLRDTPIMIFDEASSALDSDSEQRIVDALHRLRQNRTTLTIAHRFSTTRAAHRVIYFNGDGTVTPGTHDELMASHAAYRNAVDWQTTKSPDQNKRPAP